MRFRPLHDRILVKRIEEKESVRGGIVIPDTAKEKPQEGVVLAVGTGRYERGQVIPLAVKEGDRILFGKYSGSEIRIDAQELLILSEHEVLGILAAPPKDPKHRKAFVSAGELPGKTEGDERS